jgi:DNA-directed RNA polymerase specialized sigma subunit
MADQKKDMLNHFISEHAGLINMHANQLKKKGMVPSHIDQEDLHEAGILGLMHAAVHYNEAVASAHAKDPDANHFAKYANGWIKGKMMERLKQEDQVPLYFRRKSAALKRKEEFQPQQPAAPTAEEPAITPPVTSPNRD